MAQNRVCDTKQKSCVKEAMCVLGIFIVGVLIIGGIAALLIYVYAAPKSVSYVDSRPKTTEKSTDDHLGSRFKDVLSALTTLKPTKTDAKGAKQKPTKKAQGKPRRHADCDKDQTASNFDLDCLELFFETQNLVCLKRANSTGQDSVNPQKLFSISTSCRLYRIFEEVMIFSEFRKQVVEDLEPY